MRLMTKILIPLLVLAMVGVADAKGVKKVPLIKGKIQSITNGSITITSGKKNVLGTKKVITTTGQTLVTINGIAGKQVSDLLPGQTVIINASSGAATEITATTATSKGHRLRKV